MSLSIINSIISALCLLRETKKKYVFYKDYKLNVNISNLD